MPTTNYADAEVVRKLSVAEISKLTNAQLKLAIASLLGDNERATEPTNGDLMNQLHEIKEEIKGLRPLRQEVDELKEENRQIKEELRKIFEILHHQQLFTESVERRERQKHLIVTGISEDADGLGADDQAKLSSVLREAGCSVDVSGCDVQRLGEPDPARRRRPIKVTLRSARDRDNIITSGKSLKGKGERFNRIYLKKDTHPVIRKETNRLKKREFEESKDAANAGVDIQYDWQNRVLLRDGVVIDRFIPRFF